jgi:hypothetical protein
MGLFHIYQKSLKLESYLRINIELKCEILIQK